VSLEETESEGDAGDGGSGRYKRKAARRSPGASNATAGKPYVAPRREARAPPREWPVSQMLASGKASMRSSIRLTPTD